MSKMVLLRAASSILFTPALFLAGCAPDPGGETAPTDEAAGSLEGIALEPIKVTMNATTGGTFQGNGTSFKLPAGAVFIPGGQPANIDTNGDGVADSRRVEGSVQVEVLELLTPQAMAEAGRPTVTSSGQLLQSGGAFDLTIRSGTQVVQVTSLRDLTITPIAQPSSRTGMEQWVNDNTTSTFRWRRPATPTPAQPIGPSFFIPVVPGGQVGNPVNAINIDKPEIIVPNPESLRVAALGAEQAHFFPDKMFSVVTLERRGDELVSPVALPAGMRGQLVIVTKDGARAQREIVVGQ